MDKDRQYTWWIKAISGADEVQARRFAAAIALEIGRGGVSRVVELTGMSHLTIDKGIKELKETEKLEVPERLRSPGGGRKRIEDKDPGIIADLEKIMDENTAGDNMSLVRWSNKSTYRIADELKLIGHKIDPDTVGRILKENDYSLQANIKNIEGGSSEDRDAQFRYINEKGKEFMKEGNPVISVDAKKKELIGEFKNPGRTWNRKGEAKEVNVYDFPNLGMGKATPYGIYDTGKNEGMVNVGKSHDISEFAVESIRQWWLLMGKERYPDAKELMICADGGGSNGSRNRGWKIHLQELVNKIGIPITVCHYPPGTSKWNRIEHRMFSFISMNWKGKPLVNYETVVKLIGSTKTRNGLTVTARMDDKEYATGIKHSDEEMAKLRIETHSLYPKWNYTILPQRD
ncbi:MAG: ISAzo13 family transposase [Thermoplasmataceae archaeon]